EGHRPRTAVAVDLDVEPLGQRVHDRRPDAVQTARRRVRPRTELAAGMELGEDDLDAGQAGTRLYVDGDAARTILHLDTAVGVQDHIDAVAVAGQSLVDGI